MGPAKICRELKRQNPPPEALARSLGNVRDILESLALAEDFKIINGKGYKNATVSRVELDGIVLNIKSGITNSIH
jgi:hypothetical protein